MTTGMLKQARKQAGWTQMRLAQGLGVTQGYVSLMEWGKRRIPDRIARKAARLLRMPVSALPLPPPEAVERPATIATIEAELARLGYPGLAYRKKHGEVLNPAAVLLKALALDNLEARLSEALPWLLLGFEELNFEALVVRAKAKDLQNRLGFTVALAREVAGRNSRYRHRAEELQRLEEALEPSRLAREDTFGNREASERMSEWIREHRPEAAKHWNLLTDLNAEHLPYASQDP